MSALNEDADGADCGCSIELRPDLDGLLTQHNQYFESKVANTPALLEIAHALRYQVYCLERKFLEKSEQHRDGLESDEFDDRAIHGVLFHRPSNHAMGTVRIIMPQDCVADSLPIMALLRESDIDLANHVPISQAVEISRFAISKDYRQRQSDDPDNSQGVVLSRREAIRQGNLACLSLIQFLLQQCAENGLLYLTAVMEPKLLRMLAAMGIRFISIGSLVMHHGLRQPCYCYIPTMLEGVLRDHPEYWEVITNGGALNAQLEKVTGDVALASKAADVFEAAE